MSQRLGSNINSPMFMLDPVVTNNPSHMTISPYDDQTLFIKGDNKNNIPSDAFTDNSSLDLNNVIVLNGTNDSFQLHRDTLRESLHELKRDAQTPVRQLNPQQTASFNSIVEALRLLYASQALYDLVLLDIRNIFGDVTNVKPGTVGAFFVGCFTDDKFPGPLGCSPKCASSLRPTEGTPGYNTCDDLVLIYSQQHFSSLNNKQSKHVYIYVDDVNFNGFTKDNIVQLKDAGIENASLIFGNSDGSYREVTSAVPINNLPTSSNTNGNNNGNGGGSNEPVDQNNVNTAVVFGIIIFIIVILLLVVLYQNSGKSWY